MGTFSSAYSPYLKLSLYEGRYVLSVSEVLYSFEDKYTSFKRAMAELDAKALNPKNLLVLGYGLGSIPAILYGDFGLLPQVTAVDIDPVVLELAAFYHHLPKDDHIRYLAMDALAFLEQDKGQYSLVAIDLFIDDAVPKESQTADFLQRVLDKLVPGGTLLFNWLYTDDEHRHETDTYIREVFKPMLPLAGAVSTGGYKVLHYTKPIA